MLLDMSWMVKGGSLGNERVEVCCVGKGTSSCEEIVKAKMAEIRQICDRVNNQKGMEGW